MDAGSHQPAHTTKQICEDAKYDIDNCIPQGSDWPTVSASDQRLFMQGIMALTPAKILAEVDLAHAEASKGMIITHSTSAGKDVRAYFAKGDNAAALVVI